MAYNDYAYKYLCTDGVEDQEYWKLKLGKRIKKFTKITHIRLTGIDSDTVYCEFTRKVKEVYQASVKIKDNKILVTSIDFEGLNLSPANNRGCIIGVCYGRGQECSSMP